MLSISGDKEEIFKRVKSGFSDYALFDRLVATKLRDAIKDAEGLEITVKATEKVAEKYFDVKSFRTAEQRLALSQIELIFKTAYTLILSHKEENQHLLWQDVKTLVEHYPEFANADIPELQLLLRYRNAVRIALLVIPPRRNKALIMKIAERLEGSQKDYITGGGQSLDVKRRVKIYEQEGQIEAEKRPPRERKPKQRLPGQEKTPAVSAFSVKRAKLVRLPAEEIYTVARLSGEPLIAVAAPKNVNNYVPPQLPTVPLVAPLPQPPAPKSVTTISPPAAPVEPPPLVTLAAASEASTRLALPVPKEEVKEKEPIWSPLAELSSVASSLPPMLSEFPGFPSAAEIPFASSFSLSRESSISSSALLGLSRAPSDNLSLYLSMTDPEYWRRAQTGADLSPLSHTALLPNPLLRGDSLGLYSGIMGPPAPLQRSSSNGKSTANAQAAGGLYGGETSLGFYSGNFDADMDHALKRTASSPQKPLASVQAAKGARKQARKAKQ